MRPNIWSKKPRSTEPEKRSQRRIRQGAALGYAQRVLVALDAEELQLMMTLLNEGTQPHVIVMMQEVVAGTGFNAEQEILDGVTQGGFAGLVWPDYQVKVLIAGRQRDGLVGEFAVTR